MQNGRVKSFNGRMREELLEREPVRELFEARGKRRSVAARSATAKQHEASSALGPLLLTACDTESLRLHLAVSRRSPQLAFPK
jgi:hypothetical protein